jgi:hypothetical protein
MSTSVTSAGASDFRAALDPSNGRESKVTPCKTIVRERPLTNRFAMGSVFDLGEPQVGSCLHKVDKTHRDRYGQPNDPSASRSTSIF